MKIKKLLLIFIFLLLFVTNSFAVSKVLMGVIDADPYSCGLPVTISGLDTITRNTTNQPYASSCGFATWSISGTGASINSSGQVTTNGTACGVLTITATYLGVPATFIVRVTDSGHWVLIDYPCEASYCLVGSCFTTEISGQYKKEQSWCQLIGGFECSAETTNCNPSYPYPGKYRLYEWQCL